MTHDCNFIRKIECNETIFKRLRTEETISAFRMELIKYNWKEVMKEADPNEAYELFLDIFITLYNKNCPMKQYCNKRKHSETPWMSKGIQNACKKKNTLYRNFIKYRMKELENLIWPKT